MSTEPWGDFDEAALMASVDLIGRSGAREFELGYLHDNVPIDQAGWYAHAKYKGARLTAENKAGPVEAAEALAVKLLTGAKCGGCGKLVALSDAGAVVYDAPLADGTRWTPEQLAAGQCRWRRIGNRWEPGCGKRGPRRKRP